MKTLFLALVCTSLSFAQDVRIPSCYIIDTALSRDLKQIVVDLGLDGTFDTGEDGMKPISLAVIDLNGSVPRFAGVTPDSFIYPASVYKMYVAAEVLHQISQSRFSLSSPFVVLSPNDVDRTTEITWDPRPLLHAGDTVTVGYLLDLMITRSDNTAANCLIDLAGREEINALMQSNNWRGSEVTRKFLRRKFERPGYEKIRGTETCALHAADFMYKIATNQLVDSWTSLQMKSFLGRQLDTTKLSTGLPRSAMFSHKTGWFASWTHDVGIVEDDGVRYIIACFLPINEDVALGKMKALASRIHSLMLLRRGE
jgi:beta-lactamase class A